MFGLFGSLSGLRSDDDLEDGDGQGVIWVTQNDCRTCGAAIEDPTTAPTAVDRSEIITSSLGGEPRSAFCCEECREQFVDVFGGQ